MTAPFPGDDTFEKRPCLAAVPHMGKNLHATVHQDGAHSCTGLWKPGCNVVSCVFTLDETRFSSVRYRGNAIANHTALA
jgi:hypothetical protein